MKAYHLLLRDYATPSFCTFQASYYGTLEDLKEFFAVLDPELQKQIEDNNLERDEATIIDKAEYSIDDYYHEYKNIWDCIYYINAQKLKLEVFLLEFVGYYVVCYRPIITNGYVLAEKDEEERLRLYFDAKDVWGHPGVYKNISNRVLTSRLCFLYKQCESREEAFLEFNNFDINKCDVMFDDIFGDG